MKLVQQNKPGLCVHACYAMIMDCTLEHGIREFGDRHVSVESLSRALKQNHNKRLETARTADSAWPDRGIVIFECNTGDLHAAVIDGDVILDPQYGRMTKDQYANKGLKPLYTRKLKD
jgi:hypothetical protein